MSSATLFEKVCELKDKFKHFFLHKKKLQALENYSQVVDFHHKDYLLLIKRCMMDGFLGEKEADFLCYMLEKYEVNFLDWSHRTKWLKGEIERLSANYKVKQEQPVTQRDIFEPIQSIRMQVPSHVPFELMAQQHRKQMSGRV